MRSCAKPFSRLQRERVLHRCCQPDPNLRPTVAFEPHIWMLIPYHARLILDLLWELTPHRRFEPAPNLLSKLTSQPYCYTLMHLHTILHSDLLWDTTSRRRRGPNPTFHLHSQTTNGTSIQPTSETDSPIPFLPVNTSPHHTTSGSSLGYDVTPTS